MKKIDYEKLSIKEQLELRKLYGDQVYLSVEETAFWLGLSQETIRDFCKTGRIVALKFPGSKVWRIDVQKSKQALIKLSN